MSVIQIVHMLYCIFTVFLLNILIHYTLYTYTAVIRQRNMSMKNDVLYSQDMKTTTNDRLALLTIGMRMLYQTMYSTLYIYTHALSPYILDTSYIHAIYIYIHICTYLYTLYTIYYTIHHILIHHILTHTHIIYTI